MRVAVDVMGGDRAPAAILQGCWEAAPLLDVDDHILLVGDESVIRAGLESAPLDAGKKAQYQVVATTQVIAMDEPPVDAVRTKPNSSISVMCKLAATGAAEAVISAGNTGACVAAAQLRMRNLPGVSRPGIAVMVPTPSGPVVLCDAGANITPKPKHFQQYSLMGAAYSRAAAGIANPRVGLLSIGEEASKGIPLIKEAHKLMRDEPLINFIGNVEGKDLFKGVADVVVCDGFVGNIVLKTFEGLSDALFKTIFSVLQQGDPALLGKVQAALGQMRAKHDWEEAGGAPLLGINGYCLICHGRSGSRAIKNAIRVARQLVLSDMNRKIVQEIEKSIPVGED